MPYLIDGNNLLGSWGGPAVPGDGRVEVLRRVAEFCRRRGARAVLVFDGAPFRPDLNAQQMGAVSVRFPPPGRDADSLVREIVDGSSRPAELIVVTSDKPLSSYARTRGARVLRAHEWTALAAEGSSRSSTRGPNASEKPERETDVDGWLKRFSGE
ncbi:MAG TPA: NYN domain-containing protein [Vicinamibacteria bacterium]|nr:NYN domain-containing protein [Vicinamibacteria bacterium]